MQNTMTLLFQPTGHIHYQSNSSKPYYERRPTVTIDDLGH